MPRSRVMPLSRTASGSAISTVPNETATIAIAGVERPRCASRAPAAGRRRAGRGSSAGPTQSISAVKPFHLAKLSAEAVADRVEPHHQEEHHRRATNAQPVRISVATAAGAAAAARLLTEPRRAVVSRWRGHFFASHMRPMTLSSVRPVARRVGLASSGVSLHHRVARLDLVVVGRAEAAVAGVVGVLRRTGEVLLQRREVRRRAATRPAVPRSVAGRSSDALAKMPAPSGEVTKSTHLIAALPVRAGRRDRQARSAPAAPVEISLYRPLGRRRDREGQHVLRAHAVLREEGQGEGAADVERRLALREGDVGLVDAERVVPGIQYGVSLLYSSSVLTPSGEPKPCAAPLANSAWNFCLAQVANGPSAGRPS